MINIEKAEFIGEGSHRACYAHPKDSSRCVKIGEINSKESIRERQCYKILEKRGISWDALSRFYGLVDTNLGKGAVFDLVRDYDGNISKTLEYYMEQYPKNPEVSNIEKTELYDAIAQAIKQLKMDLLSNTILIRSLLGENILFKKAGEKEGRLVIIDNIGNTDFLPLCNFSKYFSRKKIMRKWKKFECHMLENYSNHPITQRLFDHT